MGTFFPMTLFLQQSPTSQHFQAIMSEALSEMKATPMINMPADEATTVDPHDPSFDTKELETEPKADSASSRVLEQTTTERAPVRLSGQRLAVVEIW